MGEIHTIWHRGEIVNQCKLGVIDEMIYVRREEAEFLKDFDTGQEADIPYLLEEPLTVWRFPWPDEDVVINYETKRQIKESYDRLVEAINKREVRALGFEANVNIPKSQHRANCNEFHHYHLVWERYTQLGAKSIISCSKCGKMFSFSQAEVDQIITPAILSLADLDPKFLQEIVQRLKANWE